MAALLDSICCPAGGALLSLGTGAAVLSVAVQHGSEPRSMASAWNAGGELAVASGGQLHLLDNRGTTHVLAGPGVVSQPSWSADGTWVAFLRTPSPPPGKPWATENSALWVARANGDGAHPLSAPNGDVTQFSWGQGSGGEKMAFSVAHSPQYTSRIFVAAPVTAPARVFASFDELIDFSFAPDGNTLAVSYRTSPGAGFRGVLELAPLSGATPRTVYTMPHGGYVELASWWPDAKRLNPAGPNPEGPNPEDPNPEGPNPEGPNPGGIVFWSDPAGSASIAADGLSLESLEFAAGKATNLATTLTYANWLAWSPNGRTLAVVDGGNRSIWGSGKHVELCAIPAATCHAAPLPAGQLISLEPAWTASGSLLFVVAPGAKAATIGSPPDAPATGTPATGALQQQKCGGLVRRPTGLLGRDGLEQSGPGGCDWHRSTHTDCCPPWAPVRPGRPPVVPSHRELGPRGRRQRPSKPQSVRQLLRLYRLVRRLRLAPVRPVLLDRKSMVLPEQFRLVPIGASCSR